ncbi:MAG TPA: hypothetical protein VK892_21740 [Pyrinomonadaceae bacterium]|nr:hypothetical protein [Pyrinomonadaceae bacterium]
MADEQNSQDSTKSTTSTPKTTPETDPDDLLGPTEPVTPTKDDPLKDEPDVDLE